MSVIQNIKFNINCIIFNILCFLSIVPYDIYKTYLLGAHASYIEPVKAKIYNTQNVSKQSKLKVSIGCFGQTFYGIALDRKMFQLVCR